MLRFAGVGQTRKGNAFDENRGVAKGNGDTTAARTDGRMVSRYGAATHPATTAWSLSELLGLALAVFGRRPAAIHASAVAESGGVLCQMGHEREQSHTLGFIRITPDHRRISKPNECAWHAVARPRPLHASTKAANRV